MKKKWIIMGDEKKFMKDIFGLSDIEVERVKKFMEQEFKNIPDFLKQIVESDLNPSQKTLAGYVLGNTVGAQMGSDMRSSIEGRRDNMSNAAY